MYHSWFVGVYVGGVIALSVGAEIGFVVGILVGLKVEALLQMCNTVSHNHSAVEIVYCIP